MYAYTYLGFFQILYSINTVMIDYTQNETEKQKSLKFIGL